jgi:hypothetical protein
MHQNEVNTREPDMSNVICEFLNLMDAQRETAFAALEGLSEEQIWQRPAPKEWCIGEMLDHNVRLFQSALPLLKLGWAIMGWYGRLQRKRPYEVNIDNVYKRPTFPMWVGFLWNPKFNPKRPAPLAVLRASTEAIHRRAREFYEGKPLDVLGNIYGYDPVIGVVNLVQTLKVGVDHDQLHYDDVLKLACSFKNAG